MIDGTLVRYRGRLAWIITMELLHECRPAAHLQYCDRDGGSTLASPHKLVRIDLPLSYSQATRLTAYAESFDSLVALLRNPRIIEALTYRPSLLRPDMPAWSPTWCKEAYDVGIGWEVLTWHQKDKMRLVLDYTTGQVTIQNREKGEWREQV